MKLIDFLDLFPNDEMNIALMKDGQFQCVAPIRGPIIRQFDNYYVCWAEILTREGIKPYQADLAIMLEEDVK